MCALDKLATPEDSRIDAFNDTGSPQHYSASPRYHCYQSATVPFELAGVQQAHASRLAHLVSVFGGRSNELQRT